MRSGTRFLYLAVLAALVVCSASHGRGQDVGYLWRPGVEGARQTAGPGSKFCPEYTECVPISSCPMLNNIMSNECVLSNRIGTLGCGYQGSGLVCCPHVNDPLRAADGQRCGVPSVQGQGYDGVGSYPWVARIGFRNTLTGEIKFPCTGTILRRRVILTTAHCALAKADNYKLHVVRIGEYQTNTQIDCGDEFCGLPIQDIPISHVVVHPGYKKLTYENNIALIILRYNMNYTVTAQPICLPEAWSVTNNNAILVGWGKAAGQAVAPFRQQALRLPITDTRNCQSVYGATLPVNENHICAGGQRGNDACTGFGGAPLLVRHGEFFYQVGILSFGSDQCGAAGIPSVYTNVKKYITWIRENTPLAYN